MQRGSRGAAEVVPRCAAIHAPHEQECGYGHEYGCGHGQRSIQMCLMVAHRFWRTLFALGLMLLRFLHLNHVFFQFIFFQFIFFQHMLFKLLGAQPSRASNRGVLRHLKLLGSVTLFGSMLCACQTTGVLSSHEPKDWPALKTSVSHRLHLEGRLLIEVDSTRSSASSSASSSAQRPPPSPKRINAAFELDSQDQRGELRLLGPLGTTSALISWSENQAQLQSPELTPPVQSYPNLSLLAQHWLGVDLPLANILDWLEGREQSVEGWHFSQTSQLIKTVQRTGPIGSSPHVSLKLILNEPTP